MATHNTEEEKLSEAVQEAANSAAKMEDSAATETEAAIFGFSLVLAIFKR